MSERKKETDMHLRITRASLAVLLVLAIAGCGSTGAAPSAHTGGGDSTAGTAPATAGTSPTSAGDPGAAASIDSCALLSDEEIKAATGQGVTRRTASTLTQVFPSVCDVMLDGGGQLFVSVLSSGGRAMYEESFEPFTGQDGIIDEAVPGLGDKAGRVGDGELMVLAGDVLFDLQYIDFQRSDKAPVVRYLAETTLAKLPCLADGCPGFTPPPPPAAAAGTDVCALLTGDEIEQQTGFTVTGTEPGVSTCRWSLETPTMGGIDGVTVTLVEPGGRAKFDYWANDYFDQAPEHVAGIGDDAIKTGTIPEGAVHVVVGDRLMTVDFRLPLAVSDPYALVVPLAEMAVARLP